MSYDCSLCLQPFISVAVPNNDLLLKLQLWSAGSLRVAFKEPL